MDFDFELPPLLPHPITLVPATTFAALDSQVSCQGSSISAISSALATTTSRQSLGSSPFQSPSVVQTDLDKLGFIVDSLGAASAKAQELPSSITQHQRLARNPTQRVYILRTWASGADEEWLQSTSTPGGHKYSIHSEHQSPQRAVIKQPLGSAQEQHQQQQPKVLVAGMLKIGEKNLFIVDAAGIIHEQETCCVLDFYVHESCQRSGFGKLLFDYMIKIEGIDPTHIAYDRPSPKLYQFLNKYYDLSRHLPQPNQFAVFDGFEFRDTHTCLLIKDQAGPAGGLQTSIAMTSSVSKGNLHNLALSGTATPPRAPIPKAFQSSVTFSDATTPQSGSTLSSVNTNIGSNINNPTNGVKVSSAMTSSISLADASSTTPLSWTSFHHNIPNHHNQQNTSFENSNSTRLTPLAEYSHSGSKYGSESIPVSSSEHRQHSHNSSISLAISPPSGPPPPSNPAPRVSRLLASSIVFADPSN